VDSRASSRARLARRAGRVAQRRVINLAGNRKLHVSVNQARFDLGTTSDEQELVEQGVEFVGVIDERSLASIVKEHEFRARDDLPYFLKSGQKPLCGADAGDERGSTVGWCARTQT